MKYSYIKVSICIPAYKRLVYFHRLMVSIQNQSFQNFEVVITDDSGLDTSIEEYVSSLVVNFPIRYVKNSVPLGSPKNWLCSIDNASGEWIKIMHDDDFFTTPDSLQTIVDSIGNEDECVFCGYNAVYENGHIENMTISKNKFNRFVKNPLSIFSENIIGPPSVMIFRKNLRERFDQRLKWIVDWEYYIRLAYRYKISYVSLPLVQVSYNSTQITNTCFLNPAIEIPETLIFTNKYGDKLFDNIWAYDAWWRLIRNLNIRNIGQFELYSGSLFVNNYIKNIIIFQSQLNLSFLRLGFFSKCLMLISFLNRKSK